MTTVFQYKIWYFYNFRQIIIMLQKYLFLVYVLFTEADVDQNLS